MEILAWIGVFLISLFVLVKGADIFTHAAEAVGKSFGVSSFLIGITIVSIGTSLPELMTSIVAVLQADGLGDTTQIVAANIVGSNIVNIFVAFGLAALLSKGFNIGRSLVKIDLPLLVGATGLSILLLMDGKFDWRDGLISLIGYGIYFAYIYAQRPVEFNWFKTREELGLKQPLLIILGAIALYFGADWTIRSVMQLADLLGITQAVITMFAVALGTSLPEIAVSVQAARQGNAAIAVGNVLGSNMFNLLVILGLPALFSTLTVSAETIAIGIPFLILSTAIFTISTIVPKVSRIEGALYCLLYITFTAKLFGLI